MIEVRGAGPTLSVAYDNYTRPWRNADTVVLQHGFCRSGRFWDQWIPTLGNDYAILRPDLRGCGGSEDPGIGCQFALEDLVSDFFRVLDELELDSVHFVGESAGNYVGMAAAGQQPSRIRSLTVINAARRVEPVISDTYKLDFPSWPEAVAALGVEEWWHRTREITNDMGDDPDGFAWYAREGGKTPTHVAVAMIEMVQKLTAQEYLSQVKVPTLFLTARKQPAFTSSEQQESLAALVPGSLVQEVDVKSGGSFFFYYDAEQVAPEVLKFVRAVDAEIEGRSA